LAQRRPSSSAASHTSVRGAGSVGLVALADEHHRVAQWHDPFDPPPPTPAIGTSPNLGNRFDAPDASWKTLYTATPREASFGEKLAFFRDRPELEEKIAEFLEGEPDISEPRPRAELGADDIDAWMCGSATVSQDVRVIDLMHPHTHEACWPALKSLLESHGHHRMDNGAILSPNRNLTRQIAGYMHELAVATTMAGSSVVGLHFESSLWSGWQCFALWEPLPLVEVTNVAAVGVNDPDLRSAAAKVGVILV
jgi:hypothetical protein